MAFSFARFYQHGAATAIFAALTLPYCATGAAFICKDLSPDCPLWRHNMAQHQGMKDSPRACLGQDRVFMTKNCPQTCELCREAAQIFEDAERAEQHRHTEAEFTKQRFVPGVGRCVWVVGSVWNWNSWRHITFGEDGRFFAPTAGCEAARCRWSCSSETSLQIAWDGELHEIEVDPSTRRTLRGNRVFVGEADQAELVSRDLYRVLGLDIDASQADIRKAYRKLSLVHHPDKSGLAADAQVFAEIAEAYETLGDEDRRAVYDSTGTEQFHSREEYERGVSSGRVRRARSFYANSDTVTSVNSAQEYDRALLDSKPTLAEFYAPWCSHCQQMAPAYKRAAVRLDREGVKTMAVDCDLSGRLCERLGITGYPTVRFYARGAGSSETFGGEHTADALVSFALRIKNSKVIPLDQQSFASTVLTSMPSDLFLVDFSAGSWCGPCTEIKSHLRELAEQLDRTTATTPAPDSADTDDGCSANDECSANRHGRNERQVRVRVGIVDCDVNRRVCEDQGVGYYPQLRLYSKANTGGEVLNFSDDGPGGVLKVFGTIISHVNAAMRV